VVKISSKNLDGATTSNGQTKNFSNQYAKWTIGGTPKEKTQSLLSIKIRNFACILGFTF